MRVFRFIGLSIALLMVWVVLVMGQDAGASALPGSDKEMETAPATPPTAANSFEDVVDRMVESEHRLVAQMRHLKPIVETYLQNLKTEPDGRAVPSTDQYFLGRLDMSQGLADVSLVREPGLHGRLNRLTTIFTPHFQALGFAQMIVPDTDFYKKYYNFTYVRREFLGEVRCIVIDAEPKADAPEGRFQGRIWVEDQDYNIVRFNGTYSRAPMNAFYLHFDSWRLNLRPGLWLPAYVYSEESDLETRVGHLHLKAQTRLWGYDLKAEEKSRNEEFTQIVADSGQVKDQSGASADAGPVMAERMWQRQAEDNALERLENIGLLAPAGGVDTVLQTVVNNLLLTNNLALQSDVRCRVLLTAPLESFTIGHTIVVSRGLLDVLPDEAALAMVLAHELSHIVLGHSSDTKLAFNDRMFFPDEQSFQRLDFKRPAADEDAADAKALELLNNSPYKEKLATAGLFLRELQQRAPELPNLIHPHLGNSFAAGTTTRMGSLLTSAPQLDAQRIDQIAALPLGGRIKLDPWSDQVEIAKAQPVTLVLAREKMPFEVTPFFPYLTRLSNEHNEKVAFGGSGSK
jgi:hypothetical protein